MSNITAPTYKLSKYVASILQQSAHGHYNVSDSFEFAKYVPTVKLPPGYVLVSFDVVSLFTNIPKDLVLRDIIMNWQSIKKVTNINLDLFLEIVEFCLDSSYFCFRGKYYVQTFGTAMGSPLSPILADLVMDTLLCTVVRLVPFPIPILKKFVDDLLLALPMDQIQTTLDIFNSYNPYLQFTIEKENDNKLPFLDTLITRHNDQTLSTTWYSKPIASGRLMNYHSFHPTAMKMNVASNFIERVTRLSTNPGEENQKHIIFQNLRRNNFPSALINRMLCRIRPTNLQNTTINDSETPNRITPATSSTTSPIQQHQNTPSSPSSNIIPPVSNPTFQPSETINSNQQNQSIQPEMQQNISPPPIRYRSVPFIPQLSTKIAHTLKHDYPHLKLAYRTIKTTKNLLRPVKDPVPNMKQSQVIYNIPCKDCNKTYIGMTKNQLRTRISGHQTHINKYQRLRDIDTQEVQQEINKLRETTALMNHAIQEEHSFDLTKTTILDRARRVSALPILEMCHIANNPNTVNHRTDVDNLNTTYAGILHSLKNRQSRKNRRTVESTNTHEP